MTGKKKPTFTPVSEKEVTRAIVDGFARQFIEYMESNCLIIRGGFWIGGYLMNKVTAREPGQKIRLLRL